MYRLLKCLDRVNMAVTKSLEGEKCIISPASIILFIGLLTPVLLLLIVAFFWKKARTTLLVIAIVLSSVETYYVLYKQEASLQVAYERESMVNDYLKEMYPTDAWVSRQATHGALPGVEVVFVDEPEVAYLYVVDDGDVRLAGHTSEETYENPKRNE